jgi:hypothetical protein
MNHFCFWAILLLATQDKVLSQVPPVTFINMGGLLHPVSGFMLPTSCVVDMNGDFLDDVVRIGAKGMYIDYQRTDGKLDQTFFTIPIQGAPDWSICAGDLDNNGFNDLLFGNKGTVSFLMSDQAGSQYTESVMPVTMLSQRSTMADINNDGLLDAFVCNDTSLSYPFRNLGAGQMVPDTQLISTSHRPGSYSAIWTDYDNDRDLDLYITKCFAPGAPGNPNRTNLLYRNNSDGTFTEVGQAAGLADNAQSWSTVFEDFDNDGDFDAFIVNHDQNNRLFRNNGNGTFTNMITGSGIDPTDLGAWENTSGDFNNDGFMDIFSELTNRLYLGKGDLTFQGQNAPVTPGAIGDLNNDGLLDVVKGSQLWLNDRESNSNHWVKMNLRGLQSNRNGIGAKVAIYGGWGKQVRELRSGQSYSPMNTLTLHFGLGQYNHIDSVGVFWPSGMTTQLFDLQADDTYLIPEVPCVKSNEFSKIITPVALCPEDSTVLTAPSGYSAYRWSTGALTDTATVSQPGRYFALLTDTSACSVLSNVFDVRWRKEATPGITASKGNIICAGDTVVLSASGGASYHWSTGETTSSIAIQTPGMYQVQSTAICSGAILPSEFYELKVLPAPAPTIPNTIIAPGDSVWLVANTDNCYWYDQMNGGNLLEVGDSLLIAGSDSSAVYYAESHHFFPPVTQAGGKQDTTGTGGLPAQSGFLHFKALHSFTLKSVVVYLPEGAIDGSRIIQLFSTDTLLKFKQFQVQSGANTLDLNFEITPGVYSLRCPQGNLFRNKGVLQYPYSIGDAGWITNSSFGPGYYYYFYDWQITQPAFDCISNRIPVYVQVNAVSGQEEKTNLTVSPNPASHELHIKTGRGWEGMVNIRLSDIAGRLILEQNSYSAENITIALPGIQTGIYILTLTDNLQRRHSFLIKVCQ